MNGKISLFSFSFSISLLTHGGCRQNLNQTK